MLQDAARCVTHNQLASKLASQPASQTGRQADIPELVVRHGPRRPVPEASEPRHLPASIQAHQAQHARLDRLTDLQAQKALRDDVRLRPDELEHRLLIRLHRPPDLHQEPYV